MAHQVGRNGYAETSVADVLTRAGVSRKTFYEHFTDKLDCFLAAYEELSARLLRDLVRESAALSGSHRSDKQMERYITVLSADMYMARAFVVEVMAAGPKSLKLREEVNQRFADLVFGHLSSDPMVRKALIAGVHGVVSGALLRGEKNLEQVLPSLQRFLKGIER